MAVSSTCSFAVAGCPAASPVLAAGRGDKEFSSTCSFAAAGCPAASPVLVPRPWLSRSAVRRGSVLGAGLLVAVWATDALAAPCAVTFLVLMSRSCFCLGDRPTVCSHKISGTRLPCAATGLTVEEMKRRLRKHKMGDVLADLVAQLEESVLEEESEETQSNPGPLRVNLEAGVKTVVTNGQTAPIVEHPAKGEAIFEELVKLDDDAHKDDYFDYEANEWDIHGLRDDLRLAKAEQQGEAVFELAKLHDRAHKDDYFDYEANEWDMHGLREDLRLAKAEQQGAAAAPPRTNQDLSKFVNCDPSIWLKGEITQVQPLGMSVKVSPPGGGDSREGFVHVSKVRAILVQDLEAEYKPYQEVHVRVVHVRTGKKHKMVLTMLSDG